MKKKNSFVPYAIATAALAALAGGTLLRMHNRPEGGTTTPEHTFSAPQPIIPDTLPSPAPSGAGADVDTHSFMFEVATDDNGSHLKRVSVPASAVSGTGEAAAIGALNAMASESNSPLPSGTQANSYTVSDNGVAIVDFNQAFVDNFKGGDEAEALTINAVLATIGQFGPRSVQITVAGKKIDSLGGTLSLANPVPVPQASEQTAQSGGKQ